jgi:glutathione S-transferase
MKLYFSPGACGLASQMILREAGLTVELVKVDLATKKYGNGQDFEKINPKGYIPALQFDDGSVLTEGVAILQWAADQAPEKNLIPKAGTMERYRAIEWLNYISSEIHKSFSPLFGAMKSNEPAPDKMVKHLLHRLEFADNHLRKNSYLLGDQFTVADAYLFNVTRWARFLKIDISGMDGLNAFLERVAARPSAKESTEAEGIRL